MEELREILLNNSTVKTWKYNSLANKYLQYFYQVADLKDYSPRGLTIHIDDCPINSRVYRGKTYANLFDDCLNCKYCISNSGASILCSGRRRIATIQDFKIPEDQRLHNSNIELAEERKKALAAKICPYCGSKLIERSGIYGTFWGCEAYPHCQFTASVDPKTGKFKTKC